MTGRTLCTCCTPMARSLTGRFGLLQRFGAHWRVLLHYLILFGFVYPARQSCIPTWVMQNLLARLQHELHHPPSGAPICQGTLLSRAQYLIDLECWGYRDARLRPTGPMRLSRDRPLDSRHRRRGRRTMTTSKDIVRLAALGDLHYPKMPHETLQGVLTQATEQADVLLLCGDLTDYGQPEEAHQLAQACITYAKIPTLGILGNHDYQSGKHEEVWQILCDAGIIMLNGDACEVRGVGFAGVKGFGGGFGQWALQAWGKATTKQFVREAVDEALELESALAKLRTPQRIVLLHYSPIRDTVVGEPPEIFAFLGSSRLEEPLNRYSVLGSLSRPRSPRSSRGPHDRGRIPI